MTEIPENFDPIMIANMQFNTGDFQAAEKSFLEIIKKDPKEFQALILLGNLTLFSNRFQEAEEWLLKATKAEPTEPAPHALLAEVYYRQDKFKKAAQHFREYGINDLAKRLESFKDKKPYKVVGNKEKFIVKMKLVDPLPVIEVKINGGDTVNFLIDTGAAETIIDKDFAEELQLETFTTQTGTFTGGAKAPTTLGKAKSITLGDLTVVDFPVTILPVRPFSQIFGGMQIDGIIGTVLFYHFITTMDYPKGELVFRRNTKEQLKILEKEIKDNKPIEIPFWMAEDHFMVAWGSVNNSEKTLFFLDTGLAGGGFTGSKKTIEDGNVELDEENAFEGIGGGGKIKAIPFVVKELAFGDAVEKNINGVFTENFPIEYKVGFRIGGIISHQFFKPYTLTFDFLKMRFILVKA
ncbi:MAG: aspartyl protease family protein [Candidatus Heimdallarchaeota archaeon]